MRKLLQPFKKKYVWALVMGILLSLSSAFTLLDAFVIPKTYVVAGQNQSKISTPAVYGIGINTAGTSGEDTLSGDGASDSDINTEGASQTGSEPETNTDAATTDYSYKNDNISINIEKFDENGVVFYVADIKLSDISYLKTAFANNTFGKNITQTTSEMAQENNAVFAINGDYYGFRDTGLIIRNGVLYRDVPRSSADNQALTINIKGELEIVNEGEVSGTSLVDSGILQSFSFGPALVLDGQAAGSSSMASQGSNRHTQGSNPRTAIGQISPLHYIFIVVDGRSTESNGMTLTQLAQEFAERGATVAYNLDGGGSSTMYLNGKVINNPTDGRYAGERSVSDIIYIGK